MADTSKLLVRSIELSNTNALGYALTYGHILIARGTVANTGKSEYSFAIELNADEVARWRELTEMIAARIDGELS